MSFKTSDLSVLAYANNFTLWHYKTIDADVIAGDYFNVAADMLRENDLILTNIDIDGTPSTTFYVVTGNSGGVVTIAAYS